MPCICVFTPQASRDKLFAPMVYHAYMMAGGSGVLYAGITSHLERRVAEHKSRSTRSFTSIYNVTKLVYSEPYNDVRDAIAREKQWKTWRRQKRSP